MKAIVINPAERTIHAVDIGYTGKLQPFYEIIGCDLVEIVRLGALTPGDHVQQVAIIDEEGMLKGEQSLVRLGDMPLAGTIILVGEVTGPDGADFTDTSLTLDYVEALFIAGQFGLIDADEARDFVRRQQQADAERYRAMGYDVSMTGDYGFIATEKGE